MDGKLRQLMKHEGINSTRLAEILGIQASGISHIMSGRNKPSFDFLLKLLQRFPQINPDWLLLDKGPMYRDEIKNKSGRNTGGGGYDHTERSDGGSSHGSEGANVGGGLLGPGSSVGGEARTGHTMGGTGDTGGIDGARGVPGGLFGPDNNDIIPSGRGLAGQPVVHSGEQPARHPVSAHQHGGYSGGHAGHPMQSPVHSSVHQAGGFTRSASIERIVVFYKDKTFSEYQPE